MALELYAKDRVVDAPKIEFSTNKMLAESDENLDHPTTLPSVMLRSAKSGHSNSGAI